MAAINPFACFDCLAIGIRLQRNFDYIGNSEFHLFSYFACLLSLYRGNPVAEWQYSFAGTKQGSPFSEDIDEAIQRLLKVSLLNQHGLRITISDRGIVEYETLLSLRINAERDVYIEGACTSALALPMGAVRHAVYQEPQLKASLVLNDSRRLLEGPGVATLHDHFSALSQAIGIDAGDLIVPATVWLSYLLSNKEREEIYAPETLS
jgi:hypothetical protein